MRAQTSGGIPCESEPIAGVFYGVFDGTNRRRLRWNQSDRNRSICSPTTTPPVSPPLPLCRNSRGPLPSTLSGETLKLQSKQIKTTVLLQIQEDDDDFVDPPQRKKTGEDYNSDSLKFFLIQLLAPNVSIMSIFFASKWYMLIQIGLGWIQHDSKKRKTTVSPPTEEDDDDFVNPRQRKNAGGQKESRKTVTTVCPEEDDDGDDDDDDDDFVDTPQESMDSD
ncbi:hypothetical protein LXL04_012309 [Taraxacum kok-saghyz]